MNTLWEPRQRAEASCLSRHYRPGRHRAPWPSHDCGLWALKTSKAAGEALAEFALNNPSIDLCY
jgi:hypothetical protein